METVTSSADVMRGSVLLEAVQTETLLLVRSAQRRLDMTRPAWKSTLSAK
jgi:hypothetical protein